jgi:hypothetical protein
MENIEENQEKYHGGKGGEKPCEDSGGISDEGSGGDNGENNGENNRGNLGTPCSMSKTWNPMQPPQK